jgi:hypothetical protein
MRALENSNFGSAPPSVFRARTKSSKERSREPVDLLLTDVGLGRDSPHGIVLSNMAQRKHRRLKVILMSG